MVGPDLQNNDTILRIEYATKRRITGHGYVVNHFTLYVGKWVGSDKPGTKSTHIYGIHPRHRATKLWDQIWRGKQNSHVKLRIEYVVK